jgi:hypothetical protein
MRSGKLFNCDDDGDDDDDDDDDDNDNNFRIVYYQLSVRGSNPSGRGARFSLPFETGPKAQPASYALSTGTLSRGKAAGSWR